MIVDLRLLCLPCGDLQVRLKQQQPDATACETALESHRQSLYIQVCMSKDSVNDLEGVLYTTSCGKEGVTEGRDRDYLENKVKLGSSVGGTARPGLVSCAISSRPRLLRLVLSLPTPF